MSPLKILSLSTLVGSLVVGGSLFALDQSSANPPTVADSLVPSCPLQSNPVQSDNDKSIARRIARQAFLEFFDDNELEFETDEAEVEVEADDPKENLEVEINSLQIADGSSSADLTINAPFFFEAEVEGDEDEELEIEGSVDLVIDVTATAIIERRGEVAVIRTQIDTIDLSVDELRDVEPDDIEDLDSTVAEQLDAIEPELRIELNQWFNANPLEMK